MDGTRFDDLVRDLLGGASRRGLLRSLGALPVVGGLAAVVDEAEAKKNNKNKNNNKGNAKKRKQRCQQKKADACDGQCGTVTVKCKAANKKQGRKRKNKKHTVDCGPCVCEPACTGGQCCSGTTCVDQCPGGGVCVDGTCAEACVCSTGCPFTSVQDAIDAVEPGTTINLCAGTFVENITIDKNLTLIGAGTDDTILDGNDAGSVIAMAAGLTAVELRNLTVRNGTSAVVGGGISNGTAQTTLRNVLVTDNVAVDRGGGIDVNTGGLVTLIDSQVTNNVAGTTGGGGIYSIGAVSVTGSTFSGNTTTGIISDGAAIYNSAGTVDVTDSTFSNNIAARDGGGIYNAAGTVEVTDSTFTDNTSTTNSGAGLYNAGGSMTLSNTDVTGGEAGDAGGGIYNRAAAGPVPGVLTLDAATSITGNFAANFGGGIFNTGPDATVVCGGATITGNTADDPPVASNCEDSGGGVGCNTCA